MPSSKKIKPQANTRGDFLPRILRSFWQMLVYTTIFIITLTVLLYSLTILVWHITPRSVPIDLGNGFIYAEHPGVENDTRMLTDQNGNVIIQQDVETYTVVGNTVYGSRIDPNYEARKNAASEHEKLSIIKNGRSVYFICTFGEDCNNTQDYSREELQAKLQARNLPPFSPGQVTNLTLLKATVKRFFGFGAPKDFHVKVETIQK